MRSNPVVAQTTALQAERSAEGAQGPDQGSDVARHPAVGANAGCVQSGQERCRKRAAQLGEPPSVRRCPALQSARTGRGLIRGACQPWRVLWAPSPRGRGGTEAVPVTVTAPLAPASGPRAGKVFAFSTTYARDVSRWANGDVVDAVDAAVPADNGAGVR